MHIEWYLVKKSQERTLRVNSEIKVLLSAQMQIPDARISNKEQKIKPKATNV